MVPRTVLDEFFRKAFREKFYESLEAFHADPDALVNYYYPPCVRTEDTATWGVV